MARLAKDHKYIDISKIISESKSDLLKKLPGFVVKAITRIVKEEELNHVLNKYSDDFGVDFLSKIIVEFNLNLEIEGKENLPESGRCFFASNHPFGIIDGLVLTHTVSQKYGSLKAIGNDAFMFIPQLRPLIAAVNVFGRSSKEYIKVLDDTYDSEIPITHFPAGLVSRRFNGIVQDSEWQKSFISKAVASKRDIVPFFFYGRNSRLFYMIHSIRQMLGIKMNIELMLLPREMFRKRNSTIKVKIGKPIPYTVFDDSLTHREWANKVRSHVYEMGKSKSVKEFNTYKPNR
jgi:putative hemolysin